MLCCDVFKHAPLLFTQPLPTNGPTRPERQMLGMEYFTFAKQNYQNIDHECFRKKSIYNKQEWKVKTYCSQHIINLALVTTSYLLEWKVICPNWFIWWSDEILCICEAGHIFHCTLQNMKIWHRLKPRIMSWLPVDGGRAYRGSTKLPECHWECFQDQA